ncbi:MAG: septum formation initiator family protein [Pseudomonadota bacterium]
MGLMERLLLGMSCLMMAGLLLLIVFSEKGGRDWLVLDRELKQVHRDIVIIEQENREIVRRITRLKQDPLYIEHLARHELEMAAQDELVFRTRDQNKGKKQ